MEHSRAEPAPTPLPALAAAQRKAAPAGRQPSVNALLARTVLEKACARVVRAKNGTDAIVQARNALTQSTGFDLVLMDIHMPDMDGV